MLSLLKEVVERQQRVGSLVLKIQDRTLSRYIRGTLRPSLTETGLWAYHTTLKKKKEYKAD